MSAPEAQPHAENGDDDCANPNRQPNPPTQSAFWKNPNHWVAIATVFIAVANALYTFFALQQWNTMKSTLTEMQHSGATATAQAWASVGNLNWLARQMGDARDQSIAAAKNALNASIDISRNDQRAWVTADTILSDPSILKEGVPANVFITFKNSGKSPALYLSVIGKVDPVGGASLPSFSYESETTKRFGVLGPNVACFTSFPVATMDPTTREKAPLTGMLFHRLVSGDVVWYFHGVARYRDIFGRPHWTTFCYYMHDLPGPAAFGGGRACENHNNAGDGENPPNL